MADAAKVDAPKDADVDDVDVDDVDKADKADDDDDDADAKKALGDAGKQALDRTKEKWRTERDARKALEAELAKLKAPKVADRSDDDKPDLEALRTQAREEAKAESLKERVLDRLEAKAAKLFTDPEDARAYLAKNVDDFIDGQSVDNVAILEALEDLLKKKPYLGVTQGDAKRFHGSGDQGAKGKPAGKPQLSDADVKRMYREGKYEEIEKARGEGRLNDLLGIKPS